jgi:hypothetical protein
MNRFLPLLVLVLSLNVSQLSATPTVGATAAAPTSITVGVPTTVTVTSQITDPSLITTGINLLRLTSGTTSTILAQLHDDGLDGDATAGDKIFSARVTLNEATAGQVQLQVSAAFKGVLKRALSNVLTITVAATVSKPTITAVASPLPNSAGWNKSDVTVTFSCSDATSGISFCPPPVTVSTEGANQVVSGTARNNAGGTATASITIKLDRTPPVVKAVPSPLPNAAGWNKSDVSVAFNCSDALSGVVSCPSSVAVTTEGLTALTSPPVLDVAGNSATTSIAVRLDKTPPSVIVGSPTEGATLFSSQTNVSGTITDSGSGVADSKCNGAPAQVVGGSFGCGVTLALGVNAFSTQATDFAGNSTTTTTHVTLLGKPVVSITSPTNLSFTSISPVTVRGTVDDTSATVTVNGLPAFVSAGAFSVIVPLNEGSNTLTAVAQNAGGNQGTADVLVTLDTTPPHVSISSPADNSTTTESTISVSGIVNDIVVGTVNNQEAQVTVNGVSAQVANRAFSASIPLALGTNNIQAVARDRVGNSTTANLTITRASSANPPKPIIGENLFNNSLSIVSGTLQSGIIGSTLPQPLTVFLHDPLNNPVPNQTIVFRVASGGGTLSTGGAGAPSLSVNTDVNGQASASLLLGTRSGAGSNTVQASNVFALAPVNFIATALPGPPANIVIDSGDNQAGAAGSPLTFPLVAVVTDAGHNRVSGVPVTFAISDGGGTLNGSASQIINTDSDGRAQAVLTLGPTATTNLVQARFGINTSPVSFTSFAKIPGDPAQTSISGVVLDNSNNAIPNVTLRLYQTNQGNNNNLPTQIGQPVTTGADGKFQLQHVPVGFFKLMADGTTAGTGNKSYPTLEYDIVTVAGVDNTVGTPIYLPVLDNINKLCVDETHGGTLTLPTSPGFSLKVVAGSATFPGGSRTGCVSVSPVNGDKIPMTPGFGQQPRYIVTIQPVGTMFNPPAAITLPNVDGLAPRAKTEMYSYDHDLSMFVAIGTATVSDDGSIIASDPGVGVLKAGWHCGGDPNASGHVADCGECNICKGDHCEPDPNKTDPSHPLACNGKAPNTKLSFNGGADSINISISPSCKGYCGTTTDSNNVVLAKCLTPADTGFNIGQITDAVRSAFSKVFDNSDPCMESGLRKAIQDKIKRLGGIVIGCRPDPPDDQGTCAEAVSVRSNNFTLRPGSMLSTQCGPLDATLLHEMIHGLGDDPGAPVNDPTASPLNQFSTYHNSVATNPIDCRDRPYGCVASCFGAARGNAAACQQTPDNMNAQIQQGNGGELGCNPCRATTVTDQNGVTHNVTVCPTIPTFSF